MRERLITVDLKSLQIFDIGYIHSESESKNFRARAMQDRDSSSNRNLHLIRITSDEITSEKLA